MHLRRFRGRQLTEVMRQVREELGPDALILHTKSSRPRGVLGLVRSAEIEILAALDDDARPGRAPVTVRRREERVAVGATAPRGPSAPARPTSRGERVIGDLASSALAMEVAELRRLVVRAVGARSLPRELASSYARLLDRGVDERLALDVLEAVAARVDGDDEPPLAAIEAEIAGMVPVGDVSLPPRERSLALVGPTGTGKTMTLVKLAARSRIAGLPVSVVSLDHARLGAAAALDALAAILRVPCTLAMTADDLRARRTRADAVELVDTPGLSPRDTEAIEALAALLAVAAPAEVHLVLSATSKTEDLLGAIRAFKPLGVTHLCVTRLDETTSPGSVLAASVAAGLALSYVGIGPDVPDDLVTADARELAARVVHGDLR